MKKSLLFLGFVLVLFLAGCSGVRWQIKDTYIVVYEIRPSSSGSYGLPIVGARVTVSGPISALRYTDSQGKAHFRLLPGTYTVSIEKSGYLPLTDTITIYTLELFPGQYVYGLIRQGG